METIEKAILSKKLEETLSAKSKPIADAIAQIERTNSLLDDYIVPTERLSFTHQNAEDRVILTFQNPTASTLSNSFSLHPHATGQIADKMGVPSGYLKKLCYGSEWEKYLATTIMNTHNENTRRDRVLIRAVQNEVRGYLSDRYRRLNGMEIFTAFLIGAQATNSVLVDAYSGETKGFLEVIHPEIIEFDTPLNGKQFACFGARIRNSDFGDGALELRIFMMNVVCMNGMVGESLLKEFHLGNRLPLDLKLSEDTYIKETQAKAALVADIMRQVYLPQNTERMIEAVTKSSAQMVNLQREVERLPKLGLTMTESETVEKLLMENNPDNGLQGQPTLWKLVNAMTAVARDSAPDRKRELETIASNLIFN